MRDEPASSGHCYHGALASIAFEKPRVPDNLINVFSETDLELFAFECAVQCCQVKSKWFLIHKNIDSLTDVAKDNPLHHVVPSKDKPNETLNRLVGGFHEVLVDHIHYKMQPCVLDLSGIHHTVSNHAVYRFWAEFSEHEDSGGDERDVRITNTLTGNDNEHKTTVVRTGATYKTNKAREIARTAIYRLAFKTSGFVDKRNSKQTWESFTKDGIPQVVPRHISIVHSVDNRNVTRARLPGAAKGNKHILLDRVRKLGLHVSKKYEKSLFIKERKQ